MKTHARKKEEKHHAHDASGRRQAACVGSKWVSKWVPVKSNSEIMSGPGLQDFQREMYEIEQRENRSYSTSGSQQSRKQ